MSFEPLTDAELAALEDRYKDYDVPPCRVCGGKLSIGSLGGGRNTVWSCADREKTPDNRGLMGEWYVHYGESKWIAPSEGDSRVLRLVAEVRARRSEGVR